MKKIIVLTAVLITAKVLSAQKLKDLTNAASAYVNNSGKGVSMDQLTSGLKEALTEGVKNSSSKASIADGFLKNELIKIPFPEEAIAMKEKLSSLGMKSQVDKFVETLNRAAELAAKDAAPIFVNAVTSMSIEDGVNIIKGNDNAATTYLQGKTTADLKSKFLPVVKKALTEVQITKYWNPLMKKYNAIPFGQKAVNPDLDDYVTTKAMEGLFKLIGQEELKIRKDPASQISDLMKLVFG